MTFIAPRRKMLELASLPFFCGILYLVTQNVDVLILFIFGFVWNWSASNELSEIIQNKRYKMSLLKLVVSLQALVLRPFAKLPTVIQRLIAVLPAGTFWSLVIFMNESVMPWWGTFLGSLTFELLQLSWRRQEA